MLLILDLVLSSMWLKLCLITSNWCEGQRQQRRAVHQFDEFLTNQEIVKFINLMEMLSLFIKLMEWHSLFIRLFINFKIAKMTKSLHQISKWYGKRHFLSFHQFNQTFFCCDKECKKHTFLPPLFYFSNRSWLSGPLSVFQKRQGQAVQLIHQQKIWMIMGDDIWNSCRKGKHTKKLCIGPLWQKNFSRC